MFVVFCFTFHLQDGTTPLILSAAGGHTTCVLELLEQGADPNSRRATGTTPLFFAAQGGYLDVVKILIKAGASVDTPSVVGFKFCFVYRLYTLNYVLNND